MERVHQSGNLWIVLSLFDALFDAFSPDLSADKYG